MFKMSEKKKCKRVLNLSKVLNLVQGKNHMEIPFLKYKMGECGSFNGSAGESGSGARLWGGECN